MVKKAAVNSGLFLVGFLVVLYLLFPGELVSESIRRRLQKRVPDPIKILDVNIRSPVRYSVVPAVEVSRRLLKLPLEISPGRRGSRWVFRFHSGAKRRLSGTVGPFRRDVRLSLKGFPLSRVLPRQDGSVRGTAEIRMRQPVSGSFDLRVKAGALARNRLVPVLLQGKRIQNLVLKGTIKNRIVRLKQFHFQGGQFKVKGTAEFRVRRPIARSRVRVEAQLLNPVQRKIHYESTFSQLRELNPGSLF